MGFLICGAMPTFAGEKKVWAWESSDLIPDSRLHYGHLENGFRYAIFPNDHPKEKVQMHLWVQAGSRHESAGQEGLAHFLEHMAFNGSTRFPPGSLVHFFQDIGMNFGGDTNAHTAFDRTVYDIVLPEGKSETLAKGLSVMADYAGGLLLPPEEIARERGIILAEKRDRDSAGYRMQQAEQAFLLKGTRIPERAPIGLESVIKTADQANFKDFYDTWYRPERMLLLVVGDVDVATTEKKIRADFAALSARAPARPVPALGLPVQKGLQFFYHAEPGSGGLQLSIGTVGAVSPYLHNRESEEKAVLRYMGMRMLALRLERLKERADSPILSAVAYTYDMHRNLRITDMQVTSDAKNWEAALTATTHALQEALVQGFSEAEMERVRQELMAWFEGQAAAASRRESRAISESLLQDFYSDNVPVSPEAMEKMLLPFLQGVDLDAVNRTFRELWDGNNRLVRMTGAGLDLSSDAALKKMRALYLAAENLEISKIPDQKPLIFPYLPSPKKGPAVAKIWEDKQLGIRDVLYDDGTLLHIKVTDFEADRVRMRVRLGTGRGGEPWPGLSFLAADTVNFSGTGTLLRDDLDAVLAGKRVGIRFGMDTDHHFFDGEARKEELGDLLHLLRARLEDPGFREEAFSLVKSRYLRGLREAEGSVDKTFARVNPCFFTGGDPRLCPPDEKALASFTLKDIATWLRPSLASDPLEISLVGNLDPDKAIAMVSDILGKRPEGHGKNVGLSTTIPSFPEGLRLKTEVKASPPVSLVQWGFPTGKKNTSLRHRGLNLLGGVLSEELREEIRENLSVAYSPFSYHWSYLAWPGWGGIMAGVSLDPAKAGEVSIRIRDLALSLGEDGIQPELLERVRGPLLNNLETQMQDNRYWLQAVLDGSAEAPEKRDWAKTLLEDYKAWNAKALSRLAREVFRADRASLLEIRTEEAK